MSEWFTMDSAPRDGTRIRVKHELGTYGTGNTTAVWDGKSWMCTEFFIDPHTMRMYRQPTHWAPIPAQEGEEK